MICRIAVLHSGRVCWITSTISSWHAFITPHAPYSDVRIANVAQEHVWSIFAGTIPALIGLLLSVERGPGLHSLVLHAKSAPKSSPAASLQVQDHVPCHARQQGVAPPPPLENMLSFRTFAFLCFLSVACRFLDHPFEAYLSLVAKCARLTS